MTVHGCFDLLGSLRLFVNQHYPLKQFDRPRSLPLVVVGPPALELELFYFQGTLNNNSTPGSKLEMRC